MRDVVWQRNGDRWPSPVRHVLEGGDASERTAGPKSGSPIGPLPATAGRPSGCLLSNECVVAEAETPPIVVSGQSCSRPERPVELSAVEYRLLCQLAGEPTRVFTREELMREVWGHGATSRTRTLDSHACRLRAKLASDTHRLVINVWGVGLRLIDQ